MKSSLTFRDTATNSKPISETRFNLLALSYTFVAFWSSLHLLTNTKPCVEYIYCI